MEIRGINPSNIEKISKFKEEAKEVLEFRLKSYEKFKSLNLPSFGPKLDIDFDNIIYYKSDTKDIKSSWKDINKNITCEFKDLGVRKSEETLDGMGVQYQSEVIYHNMIEELTNKGVIFTSIEDAFKNHYDIVKKNFNKIVKYDENKFTALNGCMWSGGSFIYIPKGVKLDRPLQSYFRINEVTMGQFERTIIIVDDDAELSYIEGCTALSHSENSLHAGVVEIYVGKNAKCKYSTIQNWSNDVYNLVTKRAIVDDYGLMEWLDGNIGSGVTMKYPSSILKGDYAKGNSVSIAFAKDGQVLDAGAKMIHIGKNTSSNIISKSIAKNGGEADYRGLVKICESAINSKASVKCDTILLDDESVSDTIPTNILLNDSSYLEHEATVSKISEEKLFYLMSKGLSENAAKDLIILGFISDFKKELPLEYAVELNRLLKNI